MVQGSGAFKRSEKKLSETFMLAGDEFRYEKPTTKKLKRFGKQQGLTKKQIKKFLKLPR